MPNREVLLKPAFAPSQRCRSKEVEHELWAIGRKEVLAAGEHLGSAILPLIANQNPTEITCRISNPSLHVRGHLRRIPGIHTGSVNCGHSGCRCGKVPARICPRRNAKNPIVPCCIIDRRRHRGSGPRGCAFEPFCRDAVKKGIRRPGAQRAGTGEFEAELCVLHDGASRYTRDIESDEGAAKSNSVGTVGTEPPREETSLRVAARQVVRVDRSVLARLLRCGGAHHERLYFVNAACWFSRAGIILYRTGRSFRSHVKFARFIAAKGVDPFR